MNTIFKDGKIITECKNYENAFYNVTGKNFSAQFNGKGGISEYYLFGDEMNYCNFSDLRIKINNEFIPFYADKKVEMIGRTQTISFDNDKAKITQCLFTTTDSPFILNQITITPKEKISFEAMLYINMNEFYYDTNINTEYIKENSSLHFEKISIENELKINFVYSAKDNLPPNIADSLENYKNITFDEIDSVQLPNSTTTELDKAIYINSYFCALENYREIGDFKGFMAGCRYITPPRTYFRDAYFTVLSMYNSNTDKIRNEIMTLARGLSENRDCPSAVIVDFSEHWGNHYDSPSMFCIMLYDYVNNTKDFSILTQKSGDYTILEKATSIFERLSEYADSTGLIVKDGEFNRRDWADEVNRFGYVTYDEILYARAAFCLSKLYKGIDETKTNHYNVLYNKILKAINDILWDDKLGYYVNYKNDRYTEKNLSIDTVLAVTFGIADEKKAVSLLTKMAEILESRNNPDVEDFGVMCVYPLYSDLFATVHKSFQPFNYHNGSEWPYWSAIYAHALKKYNMDYKYSLTHWFTHNVEKGNFTPVEYHSPYCEDGSLLQAWSSAAAFVYWDEKCDFFDCKL